MIDKMWREMYNEAVKILNPRNISKRMKVGNVAASILTKQGNIYFGISIDAECSLGVCAERNALATMLTHGEREVERVLSIYKDGKIIPPCSACREFMMQLGEGSENIEVLLDRQGRIAKLSELVPEYVRRR